VGRGKFVEIHILVPPETRIDIAKADEIRREVSDRLDAGSPTIWLTIDFHRGPALDLSARTRAANRDMLGAGHHGVAMPVRSILAALLALFPIASFAEVAVPDTPAGHALTAFLDAVNSGDRARQEAFLEAWPSRMTVDDVAEWKTASAATICSRFAPAIRRMFSSASGRERGMWRRPAAAGQCGKPCLSQDGQCLAHAAGRDVRADHAG
jgi:hypothetical protein